MNDPGGDGRERAIAGLLYYGTGLACAIIAIGLTLELLRHPTGPIPPGPGGLGLVKVGIALFILLPVARVALMLALFLREQDYVYAGISALVLAIIGAGFLVGL
jgi:uncharacterized membrane protein